MKRYAILTIIVLVILVITLLVIFLVDATIKGEHLSELIDRSYICSSRNGISLVIPDKPTINYYLPDMNGNHLEYKVFAIAPDFLAYWSSQDSALALVRAGDKNIKWVKSPWKLNDSATYETYPMSTDGKVVIINFGKDGILKYDIKSDKWKIHKDIRHMIIDSQGSGEIAVEYGYGDITLLSADNEVIRNYKIPIGQMDGFDFKTNTACGLSYEDKRDRFFISHGKTVKKRQLPIDLTPHITYQPGNNEITVNGYISFGAVGMTAVYDLNGKYLGMIKGSRGLEIVEVDNSFEKFLSDHLQIVNGNKPN